VTSNIIPQPGAGHGDSLTQPHPALSRAAELAASVAPLVIAWAETAAGEGVEPAVRWDESDGLSLGYACPTCAAEVTL